LDKKGAEDEVIGARPFPFPLREVAVLSVALPDDTGGGPNGGLSLRDEDDLDKAGAADEVFGARPFPC